MSKMIDLSQTLNNDTPVYPGTVTPNIGSSNTIEHDNFREKSILIPSHFGTHIDAPAHVIADGKSLDQLPLDHFTGAAAVLDARGMTVIDEIEAKNLLRDNPATEYVVIRTGWERYWKQASYFEGYPVLSESAAECLAAHGLKGIGLDAISVDSIGDSSLPVHHRLLKRDLIIVENLCNLDALPSSVFTFHCVPLKIEDADGSPVRAIATV